MPINLPNILTIIRILLVPIFVIYLQKSMFMPALIIFTIAGVSDALDGLFARYLNQKTMLGAHLDPLADKLLLAAAFVTLSVINCIPDWLTVIVISRDILIMLGIGVCVMLGIRVEVKPSFASKCTTVTQLFTVFLVLLYLSVPEAGTIPHTYATWLYVATACLTIISGLHYIYMGMNIHHQAEE